MNVNRGRFCVFVDTGDLDCIQEIHDVFVLLVVYVKGRHLCFVFSIVIVYCFRYGIVDC